jgi:hypothetical protein
LICDRKKAHLTNKNFGGINIRYSLGFGAFFGKVRRQEANKRRGELQIFCYVKFAGATAVGDTAGSSPNAFFAKCLSLHARPSTKEDLLMKTPKRNSKSPPKSITDFR